MSALLGLPEPVLMATQPTDPTWRCPKCGDTNQQPPNVKDVSLAHQCIDGYRDVKYLKEPQ